MSDEIYILPEKVDPSSYMPEAEKVADDSDKTEELLEEIKDLKIMIRTLTRLMEGQNND